MFFSHRTPSLNSWLEVLQILHILLRSLVYLMEMFKKKKKKIILWIIVLFASLHSLAVDFFLSFATTWLLFYLSLFYCTCPTLVCRPQTVMVSLEGLTKIVDPSQLTADFEGSLEYNHDDWIEVWQLSLHSAPFYVELDQGCPNFYIVGTKLSRWKNSPATKMWIYKKKNI